MTQNVSPKAQITRLDHYGIIRGSGEQVSTFLQGQFGNDLTQVDAQHHQLNCYSNPKGRLLAVFRVFADRDQYYLRMPKGIVGATLNRLRLFVLMAKVTLDDVSNNYTGLGVCGDEAENVITRVLGSAPTAINTLRTVDGVSILRVPGIQDRFEIYAGRQQIQSLQDELANHCESIGEDAWMLGEITAGIPAIFTETREEFVAQMLNLQLIDALSFKKGCYPGQEIVARMHYLGKLKRRMYLATLDTDTAPPPGAEVISGDNSATAGKVVDARAVAGQATQALVVLTIASAEADNLHLGTVDGPKVTLQPLPYAFTCD